MACRIALYRGPKAGAARAARGHSCEPVLPLGRAPAGLTRGPPLGPGAAARSRTRPWTDAPPTANPPTTVKEQLVNPRIGWAHRPPAGASPCCPAGGRWSTRPPPLQPPARSAAGGGQPLAVIGFLAVVALRRRPRRPRPRPVPPGLLTIALAAAVVVSDHPPPLRARALARALAEYAVVALLAALLATTGGAVDQPPADRAPSAEPRPRPPPATQPGCPRPRPGGPGRDRAGQGRGRRRPLAGRPVAPSRPEATRPDRRAARLLTPAPSCPLTGGAHDQVPPPARRRPPHHRDRRHRRVRHRRGRLRDQLQRHLPPRRPAGAVRLPHQPGVPAHAGRRLPGRRAGRHPGRDHAGRHPLR